MSFCLNAPGAEASCRKWGRGSENVSDRESGRLLLDFSPTLPIVVRAASADSTCLGAVRAAAILTWRVSEVPQFTMIFNSQNASKSKSGGPRVPRTRSFSRSLFEAHGIVTKPFPSLERWAKG